MFAAPDHGPQTTPATAAGLPHSLAIRAQRRGNDVVVAMDRDVDTADSVDEFTRLRVRPAEVRVEDDSDIGPVEPLIPCPPV
jgi:hypothetical protein